MFLRTEESKVRVGTSLLPDFYKPLLHRLFIYISLAPVTREECSCLHIKALQPQERPTFRACVFQGFHLLGSSCRGSAHGHSGFQEDTNVQHMMVTLPKAASQRTSELRVHIPSLHCGYQRPIQV